MDRGVWRATVHAGTESDMTQHMANTRTCESEGVLDLSLYNLYLSS